MSQQVGQVDTLFLHEHGEDVRVAVTQDGERRLHAILELKETDAGPRPARLRVKRGASEDLRSPDQFVELARRAERIRISEQTSPAMRRRLQELLDGYQLDAKAVRTCRFCAGEGRYSPITSETAIETDSEYICPDCAKAELDRELAYRGEITGDAKERLYDLLMDVQDLERVSNLLSGDLDPDLTKFDEISATVDEVDPVRVDSLDLHPGIQNHLESRFDTLLPVQSLAVENGVTEGRDQLVVSAT
ncbi:MAG: DEAD/DEAH box helicase, partial [Haloarculaceae archaeon]